MNLIDISHRLDGDTPVFPGDRATSLELCASPDSEFSPAAKTRYTRRTLHPGPKEGYTAYWLRTGLHTGTHVDLPMHLTRDSRMAADFPPEDFAGRGVLLDVRGENPIDMKPEYTAMIGEDTVVLLYTGFDRYYNDDRYFTQYPDLSDDMAAFLIDRGIKMLGMDTPSPDHPPYTLHKALLENNIIIMENLTNLGALQDAEVFEVLALPLKLAAEASPVRAVCRLI